MQGFATLVGVAGIEYIVLTSILHLEAKGDVYLMTVADHLRLTSGAITRVINPLADSGLVKKTGDASDRRRTKLTLTHRGHELINTLGRARAEINELWFDWMNNTEFMIFADVVERLVESSNRALAFQNYLIRSSKGATGKG
jgi:DNA-binding MarR family transcriptional regulator